MSRRVLKWPLEMGIDAQVIEMPTGSKVLHVAMQHERPTLWTESDPDRPSERRAFRLLATGFDEIPDRSEYLGTVMAGWTVWHIYDVTP